MCARMRKCARDQRVHRPLTNPKNYNILYTYYMGTKEYFNQIRSLTQLIHESDVKGRLGQWDLLAKVADKHV